MSELVEAQRVVTWWRIGGMKRWRNLGERLYCGEADYIAVRQARKPKACVQCKAPIVKGQVYADYWIAGGKHSAYCLKDAPFVIETNKETQQ